MASDSSRQRSVGVILSYIDMALQIVISLVYTPIMLSLLGQSEYGLYSLSSSTIAYLSLITLGIGGAYIRFHMRYKVAGNEKGIRELNGMYFLFYLVAGVVALLAGSVVVGNTQNIFKALTVDEIATTRVLMALLIFNLVVSFPASLFNAYITCNERFILQRALNILRHLTSPLLVLPVLILGYGSMGYVLVTVAVNMAFELINVLYAVGKLKMRFSFRGFHFGLFKEVAVFSFFLLLNQIIDQVNGNVGNLLLGIYQGSVAVAIYGVANQIKGYFFTFSTVISSVYEPKINNMVASGSSCEEITKLMTRVGRYQFIIMSLVLSGLIFFGHAFVILWAGESYSNAYYIILLLCCPVIIPLIQNTGLAIQQAMNKHQVRSVAYAIMALVNVLISIPLIKTYSYMGAAVGTCISYIACNIIFMNIYYHKGLGLDMVYFWKQIAKFIPSLMAPVAFGIVLTLCDVDMLSWTRLIACIASYCVIYAISMYLIGLNHEEKDVVNRLLSRFFPFLNRTSNRAPKHFSMKLETKDADKGRSITFRSKADGWKNYQIRYENGKKCIVIPHSQDEFMKAFLGNYILRPSCYACQFKGDNYYCDITLGDFWGIERVNPKFNDDKGVSLVIVRTEKGRQSFTALEGLDSFSTNEKDAGQDSLFKSVSMPAERNQYFSRLEDGCIAEANNSIIPRRKVRKRWNPIRIAGGLKRRFVKRMNGSPDRQVIRKFMIDEGYHDEFSLKQSCVGCSACATVCHMNAITMIHDGEGFLYPDVDESRCVRCGLCQCVCPVKNVSSLPRSMDAQFYGAKESDARERLSSSSGGVFSLLARRTLSQGGVVFGAAFDESLVVSHRCVDSLDGLASLRGSKYVQSEVGSCCEMVKSELASGRHVLFTGTPCQVAGLKAYLGREYMNLLSVDLICHGGPFPAVFSKYLQELESEMGGGRLYLIQIQGIRLEDVLSANCVELIIFYISSIQMVRPEAWSPTLLAKEVRMARICAWHKERDVYASRKLGNLEVA